ncbi:hypothetical protein K2X30_09445 [bacterium]|nr:hypothetical protein [bacterium]
MKKIAAIVGLLTVFWIGSGQVMAENSSKAPGNNVIADVGVMGPGGSLLIYYRDGNQIVVRNCGKDYPDVKVKNYKREDCKTVGLENRIPVAAFKRALQSAFYLGDADSLKPLTPEDVKAYRVNSDKPPQSLLEQRKNALEAKLARIKSFIEEAQGTDAQSAADLKETEKALKEARAELSAGQGKGGAIKKVNGIIDDLVDNKITSSELKKVSSVKDSDQAIYTLLSQYDGSKPECGTDEALNGSRQAPAAPEEGKPASPADTTWLERHWTPGIPGISPAFAGGVTIDARIKDCAAFPGSSKKGKGVPWNLVSRKLDPTSRKFKEVWKDSNTGKLWGDRLESTYVHDTQYPRKGYEAAVEMDGKTVKKEMACVSKEGKAASAGIQEKAFGLPSIEEFEQAEKDGIREVVPEMGGHFFWSASLYPYDPDFARVFGGGNGGSGYGSRDDGGSVRCVGR